MRPTRLILLTLGLTLAGSAHAQLPAQMRGMLDSALAGGNGAEIDTLAKYLKAASPADTAEIDKAIADHQAQVDTAAHEKLANQGLMDGWKGEGQIGASESSGNSSTMGLAAGIALTKEGLHWRHNLHALAGYERNNGVTSRNQWLVAWEPNYKFNDRLFAFGLAQYERDRFAGFSSRTTLSGGLGYRAVATPSVTVDLKGGPAWRQTELIGLPSQSTINAFAALDGQWRISPNLALSENAAAFYGSANTNLTSLTALTAKLSSKLSARLSYQLTNNSNPPVGFKKTDTATRMTLVYGF